MQIMLQSEKGSINGSLNEIVVCPQFQCWCLCQQEGGHSGRGSFGDRVPQSETAEALRERGLLPGLIEDVGGRCRPEDSAKRFSTWVEEAVTDEIRVRGCSDVIDTARPSGCSGKDECCKGMRSCELL